MSKRLGLYVRACGLGSREAELLGHLATGADTHDIAQRMFLSEHTVQDHLTSIFTKAGVRNRRTLLTRAVGQWPALRGRLSARPSTFPSARG